MAELIFFLDGESGARRLARHCLEQAGYAIRTFSSVVDMEEAQERRPSLMLIAAALPDGSGLDLCRRIRRNPVQASTPIILLTVNGGEEESCAALEAGADDCLAKPFSPFDLLVRVQATLRGVVCPFPVRPTDADVVIDHRAMKLLVRGCEVVTTTLEFRLVDYLARYRGHAFTRDVLLDAVWGETQFVTPRSVDACIRRVRKKIEPDITRPTYLKTVRGIGYRFDAFAVWPISGASCNCQVCAPLFGRTTESGSLRSGRKAAS
ncbi:MAG: response regulator transcription factor [Candidatus Sulfotelmatobacter sp.]